MKLLLAPFVAASLLALGCSSSSSNPAPASTADAGDGGCTGAISAICELCADGTDGCAHFNSQCQVITCEDHGGPLDGSAPVPDATADAPPPSCTTTADCSGGAQCYFAISAGCSAKGECLTPPSGGPQCNVIEELCGCDGSQVTTGCGYPNGFASGATTGASICTDSGTDAN